MRIIYVAKHNSGNNDDEGAIAYALEKLGHTVNCIEEREAHKCKKARGDVLLFHKWFDPSTLFRLQNRIIRAFWYFDLVDFDDATLVHRCAQRKSWMRDIVPNVDIGFCTDGDWVAQDKSGKLERLTQGADERILSIEEDVFSLPTSSLKSPIKILFTGIKRGGTDRENFVNAMERQYGTGENGFYHVENGVYRKELANLIHRSSIVVAPPSPTTNNYWSNRIYLTLGFGGFLLHPYCSSLLDQYKDGKELIIYNSMVDLFHKINYYLPLGETRRKIAYAGLLRTANEHTYTHCCKILCNKLENLVKQQRDKNGWN